MTKLLVQLVLAVVALLAGPIVCATFVLVLDDTGLNNFDALAVSEGISAVLLCVAWTLIWRSQVVWTPPRRLLTVLSVFWSIGVAFIPGMIWAILTAEEEMGIALGGLFWVLAWVASVTLVWRETPKERGARLQSLGLGVVHCPNCGYNMTGLKHARCPECGSEYTLDKLFASVIKAGEELGESRRPVPGS